MRARVHKEELAGLGSSGAAMKISIPSRASSLLQPGGVRVVGESAVTVQPGAGHAAISRPWPFRAVLVSRGPSPETVLAVWAGRPPDRRLARLD